MVIKAYDLLPAQVVQPINYTWVITLSLLAVPLLKQRLGINSGACHIDQLCRCGGDLVERAGGAPERP